MHKPPPLATFILRGGRFQPLSYDTMTPEQKKMVDSILAGPRTSLDGPFNVLLRSPEMGDLAQKFGAHVRFHSSLPPRLNEFAILITARQWTAQFEWQAHRRIALAAGLSPAIIEALAAGKRPAPMQPDEEAVYNFCTEVLTTHHASDAAFHAAKQTIRRARRGGHAGRYGLLPVRFHDAECRRLSAARRRAARAQAAAIM